MHSSYTIVKIMVQYMLPRRKQHHQHHSNSNNNNRQRIRGICSWSINYHRSKAIYAHTTHSCKVKLIYKMKVKLTVAAIVMRRRILYYFHAAKRSFDYSNITLLHSATTKKKDHRRSRKYSPPSHVRVCRTTTVAEARPSPYQPSRTCMRY